MSSANAGEHDEDCGCPLCDPSGRRLQERKLSEQPKYPSQYWKWLSDTGNALGMPGTFNLADVPKKAEEMKADFDEALALLKRMEWIVHPYSNDGVDCGVAEMFGRQWLSLVWQKQPHSRLPPRRVLEEARREIILGSGTCLLRAVTHLGIQ